MASAWPIKPNPAGSPRTSLTGWLQIARHYVKGDKLKEGMLNRVEAGIRAYDPCLSCSTHAYGEMPLQVELRGPDGTLLDSVARG